MKKGLRSMYKYTYIVSGGTFDHFHQGHRSFILEQLKISNYVLLGITSDAYIQRYKEKHHVAPYIDRLAVVKQFLQKEQVQDRVLLEPIDDPYIPIFFEKYPIEAIAVTHDTKNGAVNINTKRKEDGKMPLEIIVMPSKAAEDKNSFTASRIRKGEIDREGNIYIKPEWLESQLQLPLALREELQKPFGVIFSSIDEWLEKNTTPANMIITIGDEVSEVLLKRRFGQKISVMDLYVQREKKYEILSKHSLQGDEHILSIQNPAGYITPALFQAAKTSIFSSGKYVIQIIGEEDLSVLPFILVAPLNFQIMYGQPGEGIVVILVTDESKKRAKNFLEKFTKLASK